MADYKFKLYRSPSAQHTAGRLVDELPIEAFDDASAIEQAKDAPHPFVNETDFAVLCDHNDVIIWRVSPIDA